MTRKLRTIKTFPRKASVSRKQVTAAVKAVIAMREGTNVPPGRPKSDMKAVAARK
jgi:hypothetical protein